MSRPKSREAAIKIVYQNAFLESEPEKVIDTFYLAKGVPTIETNSSVLTDKFTRINNSLSLITGIIPICFNNMEVVTAEIHWKKFCQLNWRFN